MYSLMNVNTYIDTIFGVNVLE